MRSDRLPWIAAGLTGSLLVACAPKRFVVPPSDPTPPSAVWLQVDRPGRPLLNADPGSASPADHAEPGRAMQITARADDPDGGIKDVQIWMTEQRWVDNGDGTESSTGPSLPGAPSAGSPSSATAGQVASTSGRASYSLTPPATTAGRRRYVIWAAALNFYGGTTRTQELRIDVP